ncbi:MAG: SGNH/GDSL hydrolase family protein [Alphaproteobacteria bacterium]|nr:SGNH/GDSL hydrolase family protein [Alphaproteobacteria bacterium]
MALLDAVEKLVDEGYEAHARAAFTKGFQIRKTGAFRFELAPKQDARADISSAVADLPEFEATPGMMGFLFRQAAALDNRLRNARFFDPYRDTDCTKVITQGDSWFAFPFVKPVDVSENLANLMPVFSLGCPGDDVADMSGDHKLADLIAALSETQADIVALSGGGNELIGDDFPSVLKTPLKARLAVEYVDADRLQRKATKVIRGFEKILLALVAVKPDVQICAHSYDYPFARRAEGTFLGPVLDDLGVPDEYWNGICAHIIDQFDAALVLLSNRYPKNFFRVDLRRISGNDIANWSDEIHLNSETAKLAANEFLVQFKKRLGCRFGTQSG